MDPSGEINVNIFKNLFGSSSKNNGPTSYDPGGYVSKDVQEAYIRQTQKNGVFITSVFVGGAVAAWTPLGTTGFIGGAFTGAASGFSSGFVSGFGNSIVDGNNFSTSFKSGLSSGAFGAAVGGAIGGVSGGINAARHGRNFWTGDFKQYTPTEEIYASLDKEVYTNTDDYTVFNNSDKPVYYKPESGGYGLNNKISPGKGIHGYVDGLATSRNSELVFKVPGKYGVYPDAIVKSSGDIDLYFSPLDRAVLHIKNVQTGGTYRYGWLRLKDLDSHWKKLFDLAKIIK